MLAVQQVKQDLGSIQAAQQKQKTAAPPEQAKLQAAISANTKAVDQAVAKFPDSALVQDAGAQAALQVGDNGKAQRRAGRAVELAQAQPPGPLREPLLAQALTTRALAFAAAHDFPAAAEDAQAVLRLRPGDAAAEAILKLTAGRVRGAAPKGPPQPPAPHWQGALDAARAQAALTRPTGFAASVEYNKQAESGLRLDDFEEMRRKATLALEKLPDNPKAHMQRAFANYMLKRHQESIADADAGLKLRPDSADLLALRAAAKRESGRPREALEDAKRAVALKPADAFSLVQRGLAAEDLGAAQPLYMADLKQAAELDPQFERFYTEALARRGLKRDEAAAANPVFPWWAKPRALAAGGGLLLLLLAVGALMLVRPARPRQEGVVGGCFKLGRQIGAGGMGTVYEAWDQNLERAVAVKRMAPALRDDPGEAARFIQEAKTVASLKHPNIVAIHDAFQDAGELYLVFELVRGQTLQDLVGKAGRLSWKETLALLGPLCEALDYAHAHGVIHRDLKPANIMIEDGRLKVMDFGIARRTKNPALATVTGQVVGTPPFMAPEQQAGQVSKESDLYALGICAYFMLSGALPFEGDQAHARKLEGRFLPLSLLTPEAAGCDAAFTRALHPDKQRRFHAAGELFATLREAAHA